MRRAPSWLYPQKIDAFANRTILLKQFLWSRCTLAMEQAGNSNRSYSPAVMCVPGRTADSHGKQVAFKSSLLSQSSEPESHFFVVVSDIFQKGVDENNNPRHLETLLSSYNLQSQRRSNSRPVRFRNRDFHCGLRAGLFGRVDSDFPRLPLTAGRSIRCCFPSEVS